MPAYVIVDADVTDAEKYETYKALAAPSIAKYGGTYKVRGGAVTVLEGPWAPTRVVVGEFPTVEQAKAWYDGPEYREARAARAGAANFRMIVVDGV